MTTQAPSSQSSNKRLQLQACPYLDTVQRGNLDFDFQAVCSVTLSPLNVYACLTCGRFFAGKSSDTPLFAHALEQSHYVWMNLASGAVWCVPDDYQVHDPSLDDIAYNLRPTYGPEEIRLLGTPGHMVRGRDLQGHKYVVGVIGLNDLHGTDFVNAAVQALARVTRLRRFFLLRDNWEKTTSRVVRAFGELMCQMWSAARFKSSASPHELLQAIGAASEGRFKVGVRADAATFLAWFLNELHRALGGTKKPGSSIVHECFQGHVRVDTTLIELVRDFDDTVVHSMAVAGPVAPAARASAAQAGSKQEEEMGALGTSTSASVKTTTSAVVPFTFLSLDLPSGALYTDVIQGGTVIPQSTLYALLSKYDGVKAVDETGAGHIKRRRYKITQLPECLVLQLRRFTPNKFFVEKNRSVVTLPTTQLDLAGFYDGKEPLPEYDLVANVCHASSGAGGEDKDPVANGTYRAHVLYPPTEAWYEVHDLSVRETMPQLVAVSETYLAFFQRRGA